VIDHMQNNIYTFEYMWVIYEKKSLIKTLSKLPIEVLKHYELWKRVVEHAGQRGLYLIKGFHDEALLGKWHGYRSSRLTKQWRVIYKVEKEVCQIYVIDINPHNYKRR
jgi:addiction module RelE/StbE family toxin